MSAGSLIDITPTVSPRLAVWQGDCAFSRHVALDIDRGDNITLSSITATVHLGAHADAPSHYGKAAPTMERQPVDLYVGPCDLIDVRRPASRGSDGWRAGVGELAGVPTTPRVLLRTSSYLDRSVWHPEFTALEPALIDWLADRGVRLVVVDTASVDTAESKTLPTHARCLARGVSIIEGVVLEGLRTSAEGARYELIALPLKLEGCDGSPVRAVLRVIA